jgi:hypothetical protein
MRTSQLRILKLCFLASITLAECFGNYGYADDLDESSKEALGETQNILLNQNLRQSAIGQSADALQADSQVRSIAGSIQNVEKMYQISSDVFGDIVKKSQGDPGRVEKTVDDLKTNPQALEQNMSDSSRKEIRDLSQEISKQLQK